MIDAGMVARDDRAMCHVVAVRLLETPTCRRRAGFCRGDLFPQGKASVVVSGLAGQAIFRVELGNDDKVVNEEPLLTESHSAIRD